MNKYFSSRGFNVLMVRFNGFWAGWCGANILTGFDTPFTPWALVIAIACAVGHIKMIDEIDAKDTKNVKE